MPCDARWSCSQRLNYSTKLQGWISPLFTKQQGYLYQMKADASDVLCIREKNVFNMSVIKQVPVTVLVCSNKDYTWNNSCNWSNQLKDFKLFHCHFPRSSVFCIGQPGKWNGRERNHNPLPPSHRSSEKSLLFLPQESYDSCTSWTTLARKRLRGIPCGSSHFHNFCSSGQRDCLKTLQLMRF